MITHILRDQSIENWYSDINNSSHRQFYSGFIHDLCLENDLPIERERWYSIPREDRNCNFCGNEIWDEFHILLLCCNIKTQIYTKLL